MQLLDCSIPAWSALAHVCWKKRKAAECSDLLSREEKAGMHTDRSDPVLGLGDVVARVPSFAPSRLQADNSGSRFCVGSSRCLQVLEVQRPTFRGFEGYVKQRRTEHSLTLSLSLKFILVSLSLSLFMSFSLSQSLSLSCFTL